jgi:hypothetical protein
MAFGAHLGRDEPGLSLGLYQRGLFAEAIRTDYGTCFVGSEAFGRFQNKYLPSPSVRCQGRTANQTAAKLECRARLNKPAQKAKIFSLDRIYAKLLARLCLGAFDNDGTADAGNAWPKA